LICACVPESVRVEEPFAPALIQPSSVDVRLANKFLVFRNTKRAYIDVKQPAEDLMELIGWAAYLGYACVGLVLGLAAYVRAVAKEAEILKLAREAQLELEHLHAVRDRLPRKLLAVEIRDIMFPGELKKIFTQVVRARQEGLAALEKARGETAALRNLANAAQLADRNPSLMQLRLLQVIGQQSGNTVVLGVPSPSGPIPIHKSGGGAIDSHATGPTEPEGDS